MASSYDGRFADAEFGSHTHDHEHEPPSPSAGRHVPAANSSSSRVSRRTPATGRSASRSRVGGNNNNTRSHNAASFRQTDDDEKSREQLLSELSDERARHHATTLQLHSLKGMYEQLLRERGEEKFGSRRVTLLKAQNMQMERQLSLLSEGTDARRAGLHELATIVSGLEGCVREVQGAPADAAPHGEGPALPAAVTKGQRKLRGLELGIEAAKQRVRRPQTQLLLCVLYVGPSLFLYDAHCSFVALVPPACLSAACSYLSTGVQRCTTLRRRSASWLQKRP